VHAVAYIDDMPRALATTDLAVSRAGAMMTGELQSWGIPTILVPLPTAAEDHQTTNAKALEAAGAAEWVAERDLTPESLWGRLTSLAADVARRAAMSRAARARIDVGAARAIARDLLELVPAGSR
jgi:UDP-N-acetylglucosamine--N-acetylmuramyl-(pentapeptide) pyrophosphoryl-undecaprenol N-acetylglucosamine transferase